MSPKAEFYKRVPRELKANLQYRKKVLARAETDLEFRAAMMTACKLDILFFLSVFCWVYEPRVFYGPNGKKLPHKVPFIPWDNQTPAIITIDEHLGNEDIGLEKARGEGASWTGVFFAIRDFTFKEMSSIGFVSKDEASVDTPDNPDSLFWKCAWAIDQLPFWMKPEVKRSLSEHTLRNVGNGSGIAGYACTGNVASGGRKSWFLIDELSKFPRGPDSDAMASTQHVTNSRLIVATPFGTDGEYYRLMHEPSSMVKVVLDWKDNPTRNRGLYKLVNGVPVAVDPVNNPLPANYNPPSKEVVDRFSRLRRKGFKLEDRERSPWYDHECDRPGATPQKIAQELDRDYGGSMHRYFGHEFFDATKLTVAKPTKFSLDYNRETLGDCSLSKVDSGAINVYCPLDARNRPPTARQYVVAADVAAGLGGSHSSNSCVQVFDQLTKAQVLEYSTNSTEPKDFADDCMAICKIFNNAHLAWEINGPGAAFTMQVMERGYSNYYKRKVKWKRKDKSTKEPGWHTGRETKEIMFSELHRAVKSGEVILKSELLVSECGEYIRDGGKITHIGSQASDDESSKGEAHGDRVIAAAVAIQALNSLPAAAKVRERTTEEEAPEGTMARRNLEWEERKQRASDEWDERDNADLAHSERAAWHGEYHWDS